MNSTPGTIRRVDRSGEVTIFAENVPAGRDLAFDASGNLYVTAGNDILRFNTAGERETLWTSGALLTSLGFDSNGRLFFTQRAVYRLDSPGVARQFSEGLLEPQFLAFQPDMSPPSLTFTPPGTITIKGGLNFFYNIYKSDDLITWTPVTPKSTVQIIASTTATVIDSSAQTTQARFYKATLVTPTY